MDAIITQDDISLVLGKPSSGKTRLILIFIIIIIIVILIVVFLIVTGYISIGNPASPTVTGQSTQ
jgi:hypothetical protein